MGLVLLLTGCARENRALDDALALRTALLRSSGCSFQAEVTADYGESLYTFSMRCQGDSLGNLDFELTKPETLSGIRGTISDTGGSVTFEDTALYFPLLADDQLIPASAPWIFLKTLRSGSIDSACTEDDLLRITAQDSYEEDALLLDIWADGQLKPCRADILYDGRRILSLEIEEFAVL